MTLHARSPLFLYTLFLVTLLVLSAPTTSESRRVIFYGPRLSLIKTGQILATHAKGRSCGECHMRDHRGNCRRIISFNADGVQC